MTALHEALDIAQTTRPGGAASLIATALEELDPRRTTPPVADVQGRLVDRLSR
ncbi:hypothetical protein [Nocardiopsis sp. MG754419]|uniref:hypothetical protein n=1 Tax=Nocardiopsis sp. MG754419 TaxID=2259865 RepID=UPI001BA70FC8|nr:hypothetical protein [Nocardiopsis sp. MG754419]